MKKSTLQSHLGKLQGPHKKPAIRRFRKMLWSWSWLGKDAGKSLCAGAKEAHRRWGTGFRCRWGVEVLWHPELWPLGFNSQCKILVIIDETSILNSRILAILLRGQRTNPSNIHGNVSLPHLRFATGKKSKGKNGKNGPRAQTVLRISSNIAM